MRTWIGLAAVLHFAFGIGTFLPETAALRKWRVVGSVVDLYQDLEFAQTWRMFAPPSQDIEELAIAYKLPGGWTTLHSLNDNLRAEVKGRWLAPLPRGFIRLSNHFRAPQLMGKTLDEQPHIKFYFQQLSTYFCSSPDHPTDLEAVRFYSVVRGIEPFYATNADGKKNSSAAERSGTLALYERDCTSV